MGKFREWNISIDCDGYVKADHDSGMTYGDDGVDVIEKVAFTEAQEENQLLREALEFTYQKLFRVAIPIPNIGGENSVKINADSIRVKIKQALGESEGE